MKFVVNVHFPLQLLNNIVIPLKFLDVSKNPCENIFVMKFVFIL